MYATSHTPAVSVTIALCSSFEVRKYKFSNFVLFQYCFCYLGCQAILCEFEDLLFHFCQKMVRTLMGIVLDL